MRVIVILLVATVMGAYRLNMAHNMYFKKVHLTKSDLQNAELNNLGINAMKENERQVERQITNSIFLA